MVTKQIKQKLEDGTVLTVDIGALAEYVETDTYRQFVTEDELQSIQNIDELEQKVSDISQQVSGETSQKLATVVSDIAKLSFQLDLKDVVDTSEMTHVIVDQIDAADAVVITSGTYGENTVYI